MFKFIKDICEWRETEYERKHPPDNRAMPTEIEGWNMFLYEGGYFYNTQREEMNVLEEMWKFYFICHPKNRKNCSIHKGVLAL